MNRLRRLRARARLARLRVRRLHPVELLAAALAALVALASCHDRGPSEPGKCDPSFAPPGPVVRSIHVLRDGSAVVVFSVSADVVGNRE